MPTSKQMCESCLMPLEKDPRPERRAAVATGSGVPMESSIYCSYCYKNGGLVYPGNDPKEFRKAMYAAIRARGVNPITAWFYTFMTRFAPRWKGK